MNPKANLYIRFPEHVHACLLRECASSSPALSAPKLVVKILSERYGNASSAPGAEAITVIPTASSSDISNAIQLLTAATERLSGNQAIDAAVTTLTSLIKQFSSLVSSATKTEAPEKKDSANLEALLLQLLDQSANDSGIQRELKSVQAAVTQSVDVLKSIAEGINKSQRMQASSLDQRLDRLAESVESYQKNAHSDIEGAVRAVERNVGASVEVLKSVANTIGLSSKQDERAPVFEMLVSMKTMISTLSEQVHASGLIAARTADQIPAAVGELFFLDAKRKDGYWTELGHLKDDTYPVVVQCGRQATLRIGSSVVERMNDEYEALTGHGDQMVMALLTQYAARTFARDETLLSPEKTAERLQQYVRTKLATANTSKHVRIAGILDDDEVVGEVVVVDYLLPVKVWKSYVVDMQSKYPELDVLAVLKRSFAWMNKTVDKQRPFIALNNFFANWLDNEVKKLDASRKPRGTKGRIGQAIAQAQHRSDQKSGTTFDIGVGPDSTSPEKKQHVIGFDPASVVLDRGVTKP